MDRRHRSSPEMFQTRKNSLEMFQTRKESRNLPETFQTRKESRNLSETFQTRNESRNLSETFQTRKESRNALKTFQTDNESRNSSETFQTRKKSKNSSEMFQTRKKSRNSSETFQTRKESRKKKVAPANVWALHKWYGFAPMLYFMVISGVTYWGIIEALPILYSECHSFYLRFNQVLGAFISLEIMINWYCIRYVGSEYVLNREGRHLKINVPEHGTTSSEKVEDTKNKNGLCSKGRDDNGGEEVFRGTVKKTKVFKMFVETSLPDVDGKVEERAFDYWSWKPCVVCQRLRPPRCHHCVLCQKCVLKRDHHCFFAGSCVGINNQRHFIVFLFWAFVGCLYAFVHMAPYVYFEVLPNLAYIDFILPVAIIRAVLGYQTFLACSLVFLGWALTGFELFSALQLVDSFKIILTSQTTFEQANEMEIADTRSNQGRIRGVFGYYWLLNFIVPCHWMFSPIEDPLQWPTITM